jgi:homogentisate 1,2-dioxygenase
MVAEDTFRPPYYHSNVMSEFMGIVHGIYDAKEHTDNKNGFIPGGASLHNCMTAHGPDSTSFDKASKADQKPVKLKDTLAFMLESRFIMKPTKHALASDKIQPDYFKCWKNLSNNFTKKS